MCNYMAGMGHAHTGVTCGDATCDVMPSGKTSGVTHDVLPLLA